MSEELKTENTLEPVDEVKAAPVEPIKDQEEVESPAEPVQEQEKEEEAASPVSTREEIIARLQEMVGDISLAKRPELESLKQAFYKLQRAAQEEQIAAFVVAMKDGRVEGLITDGDIRRAMEKWNAEFFDRTVSDIMTRTPKTVSPATKIADVQKLMNKHKIHNVLVVDSENHLLGIVDRYACVL